MCLKTCAPYFPKIDNTLGTPMPTVIASRPIAAGFEYDEYGKHNIQITSCCLYQFYKVQYKYQYLIKMHFICLLGSVKCKIKWNGGCRNWNVKKIHTYNTKPYTVGECYELCRKTHLCEGFFLKTRPKPRDNNLECQLYQEGCIQNPWNEVWDYYVMKECSKGRFVFLV